jgi:ferric-dicitrate binding protein FerR (iron transport regulator)
MEPDFAQLARWMGSSLSPEEEAIRSRWLASSPENQAKWADFQRIWRMYAQVGAEYAHQISPDVAGAWGRMKADISPAPPRTITTWRYWAAAAAAILLIWSIAQLGRPPQPLIWQAGADMMTVYLPDSSRVYLRPGAEIRLDPGFGRSRRGLVLTGEAFFEVRRDEAHPFVVSCGDADVQVLGTSFLVEHPDTGLAQVTVYTGQVLLRHKDGNALPLSAGQAGVCQQGQVTPLAFQPGKRAWMLHELRYHGEPLRTVLADIEHLYGISIQCTDEALLNCHLTAYLERSAPDKTLAVIASVFDMEVILTGSNQYLLRGGRCTL